MGARVVFFDLDGTLMDHQAASDLAVVRLLSEYGHSGLSRETVVGLWRTLEDEHMGRYLAGEESFSEQRRARISGFFEYLGNASHPKSPMRPSPSTSASTSAAGNSSPMWFRA